MTTEVQGPAADDELAVTESHEAPIELGDDALVAELAFVPIYDRA